MKPTKIMPYIVLLDDGKTKTYYAYRTERQAIKAAEGFKVGTNYKTAVFVSILKAKRGAK